jgi:hypothetical protein
MSWQKCNENQNFEICSEYPYQIRKASNELVLPEYYNGGYLVVSMDRRMTYKHRLIANQFIPNPCNLPQVDHIDGDKLNNHLSNLRWVTNRQNANNKHFYNDREIIYVDELSDKAFPVPVYGDWEFDELYFDPVAYRFYLYTDRDCYRELPYLTINNGVFVSQARDINNKPHLIYYSKFKRLYDI